jgi:hypothetical protein
MASYSGDFEVRTDLSEEELIKCVADKFSKELRCGEAGYTATVTYALQSRSIKDESGDLFRTLGGEQVVMEIGDSRGSSQMLSSPSDEDDKWSFEPDKFAKEMNRLSNLIHDLVDNIVNERKEEEKKKNSLAKEAVHQANIAREKKQLEELKSKYEQSTQK